MPNALTLATKYTAVDKYSAKVAAMGKATQQFANKSTVGFARVNRAARSMNNTVNRATSGITKLGGAAVGIGLAVGVASGAESFLDLDKNMSAAAAKFGVFSREDLKFKQIRDEALKLGGATEFTTGQVAEGFKNMATANFSATEAIVNINKELDFATANQAELSVATDVSAKTLSAFGLKADKLGNKLSPTALGGNLDLVHNTLTKIINTSGFGNIEEFQDVIASSGSSARAAGVDITTWGAVVASSVSEAVPASVAGTRFANMLGFMTKKTSDFNKIGVKLKDATTGNFRDIVAIMSDIQAKTSGMDKFDRAGLLLKLFGERGSKMAASILENGIPALEAYRVKLRGATTVTKDMAKFMREGLTGGVAAMGSAFDSIAIAIGDTFQPEINAAIASLTNIAQNAKAWVSENKTLIKTIFSIAMWVGKFIIAIKAITLLIAAYNVVIGIQAALNGTAAIALAGNTVALGAYKIATAAASVVQWIFAAATNATVWPILLVVAAIAAIIAIIMNWSTITKWFSKIWGKFTAWISTAWESVINYFTAFDFKKFFLDIGSYILKFLLSPITTLLTLISKIPGDIGRMAASANAQIDKLTNLGDIGVRNELINTDATNQQIATQREEKETNNNIKLDIFSPFGANVQENKAMIPIRITETGAE